MTLKPLISALAATPERAPASAGTRYGYDPGVRHRPVAAAIAIGLSAALVVAVARSPMVLEEAPHTLPRGGTLIELPKTRSETRRAGKARVRECRSRGLSLH